MSFKAYRMAVNYSCYGTYATHVDKDHVKPEPALNKSFIIKEGFKSTFKCASRTETGIWFHRREA